MDLAGEFTVQVGPVDGFDFRVRFEKEPDPELRMSKPTHANPGDIGEMVARARQGDREALEGVLATIAPSIRRFGFRMCKNVHDAEDVLQDTLINVANHLGDFEGRSSLSSWVFALTRSACARKRRGLKNRPLESDDQLAEAQDPGPTPEARAADQERASALSGALDALSDDYREVILLRDIEGLSAPAAALSLGITVDALKSRLHRAREALRVALRSLLEPISLQAPSGCSVADLSVFVGAHTWARMAGCRPARHGARCVLQHYRQNGISTTKAA